MTMLSPAATYHAELRQELGSVGRALSFQRGLVWLARGLAGGTVVVFGVVIWAWIRGDVANLPVPLLAAVPIVAGLLTGLGSLLIHHNTSELARRVDRAARLSERSTTALELGARGEDFPLALAQMRDAVEHLKRVDLMEAFPLRAPKNELMTAFFLVTIAAIVGVSPNPWLLRARASNPAITTAREEAQRVQRLADSIQPQGSAELEALRQLVNKGARTIDAQSNQPDAALNAIQDLEEQVRQMSAGDDQLASALAAIASALASDPTTQQLANAINTGDMRQISQAARDLAQTTAGLSGQDQQRVAKVLRDAANQAARSSQSVSGQLANAADALQNAAVGSLANAAATGDQSQAGQNGQPQQGDASAQTGNPTAASDALNQLGNDTAAAGERQRTASQLESSRNALERALGRTQSRSANTSSSSQSSSSGQSSHSNQSSSGQTGDQSQAGTGGQAGQSSDGTDPGGAGAPGGSDQGNGGDTGQGGGYSSGGQRQTKADGSTSQLDTMTTPQQVPSNSPFAPDQSSVNPYLGDAGKGNAQTSQEAVQPAFSGKPTTGNDSSSIPLGLRDLVKDYFSSLDKKAP